MNKVVLGGVPISIPHCCSKERLQRLLAPRVTEEGIVIPSMMSDNKGLSTVILANDEKVVAIGYFIGATLPLRNPPSSTREKLITVGVSMKLNGQWTPRIWDDLVDDDRFTIRSALGQRYRTSGMGYADEDSAYYVLEGLEQA